MQKGPKPVFISKHDAPPPSTARRAPRLPEPPDTAGDPALNPPPNAPPTPPLTPPPAVALNPDFISGQVENTLAHKTARLVDTHPEDAVRVLRGWLYQD